MTIRQRWHHTSQPIRGGGCFLLFLFPHYLCECCQSSSNQDPLKKSIWISGLTAKMLQTDSTLQLHWLLRFWNLWTNSEQTLLQHKHLSSISLIRIIDKQRLSDLWKVLSNADSTQTVDGGHGSGSGARFRSCRTTRPFDPPWQLNQNQDQRQAGSRLTEVNLFCR